MKTHVLNVAAMPQPGSYEMSLISSEMFFRIISEKQHQIESHIGYEANIDLIGQQTGVELPLLRARDSAPEILDGDTLLVMRLRRLERIPRYPSIDDFEFYSVKYKLR